jgi:PAS domain S-box-containing protein
MNINDDFIHALLIEDNPGDVRLINEMVKENKGRTIILEHQSTLSEGLQALLKDKYDVLLLDLNLPDNKGFGTFIKVYSQNPEIPIVVLTGTKDVELAIKSLHNGAQDYLTKGEIDSALLLRAISYAIERAGLLRVVQSELDERKTIERELRKVNRALRMVSECNQIIVHTSEETDLTKKISKTISTLGGYQSVHIDLLDQQNGISSQSFILENGQSLKSILSLLNGVFDLIKKKTLETGEDIICNDIQIDDRFQSLRDKINKLGYRSFMVLPLKSDGLLLGILQIYSKEAKQFDSEELKLILELREDIVYAIVSIRAQKEHLRTEETLRKSEEKWRSLVNTIPDYIFLMDTEGRLLFVNHDIAGITEKQAIGRSVNEFLSKEAQTIFRKKSKEALDTREIQFAEHSSNETQNDIKNFEDYLVPIIGQNGMINFLVISREITERKKAEEKLLIAKEKAEESDHLKTAFLHNISHEIRTPMNAIIGFSTFLNDPDLLPEKREDYTEIITQSCSQLLAVITDIISIATIEAGQEKIYEREINLNLTFKLIYEQFASKAQNMGIAFRYQNQLSDIEAYICTDEIKLTQIINNLLVNAFKFIEKGHIDFGYNLKDNNLEFYVKDSGIGIAREMHEKIFERFRQVEITETRQFGGSGLGLPISKAYVELLGGKIWLDSELDKGSTFYFTIPYKKTNNPAFLKEKQPVKAIKIDIEEPKTLLIAEDGDYNFILLKELLSDLNFNIIRAINGIQAVEICKSNPGISLVLMDIKMPIMNGIEATKLIKKNRPDLPIIAQTAYALEHEITRFKDQGFIDYVIKPIKKDELFTVISEVFHEV